jgi:hypothetical protein
MDRYDRSRSQSDRRQRSPTDRYQRDNHKPASRQSSFSDRLRGNDFRERELREGHSTKREYDRDRDRDQGRDREADGGRSREFPRLETMVSHAGTFGASDRSGKFPHVAAEGRSFPRDSLWLNQTKRRPLSKADSPLWMAAKALVIWLPHCASLAMPSCNESI